MLEGDGAELRCGQGLENAVEGADWRAGRGDDDDFGGLIYRLEISE